MKIIGYIPRLIDSELKFRLEAKGAVLIEGPKWCGKTYAGKHAAKTMLNLGDNDILRSAQQMFGVNTNALLRGATPRLIDEWQEMPQLWDAVRNEVDLRHKTGQFILTGSAQPANRDEIIHSGTGRFSRLKMRTMSLYESNESTGEVSLKGLFDGNLDMGGSNKTSLRDIAYYICRGGWPGAIGLPERAALRQAVDYYDAVINFDIPGAKLGRKSSIIADRIMKSYSRHVGHDSPLTTIRKDIASVGAVPDIATVNSYLDAFKSIFVVEEMDAWNPNLRSKTAIRSTPTRYFTDPSIACAAMGLGPEDLVNDMKAMGMMFENLCARDLRTYAESIDGQVYHYRDANGLECDCVVHLRNGKYGLVEIKLGGLYSVEQGVANLNKFATKLDYTKMREPSFKMVLTAVGEFAYVRKDGVWVVPLSTLRN